MYKSVVVGKLQPPSVVALQVRWNNSKKAIIHVRNHKNCGGLPPIKDWYGSEPSTLRNKGTKKRYLKRYKC